MVNILVLPLRLTIPVNFAGHFPDPIALNFDSLDLLNQEEVLNYRTYLSYLIEIK